MSQQEFMPESQREHTTEQNSEEIYTQSYSQYRTSDMPKRDHPADFETAVPPYSYQAQEPGRTNQARNETDARATSEQPRQNSARPRQRFSSRTRRIGDTFQRGYNFYQNQRWRFYAPQQARPVRQRANMPPLFVFLLLGVGFLCALPILIKLLLLLFAALIVLGITSFVLILCGLIIYHVYFKKYWRNSRWRWW
ncbi:hypothetical protein [Dictyobacter kobayashii]|uniref:Uncharacterized protein n=1 Tax=Dictyobacter kobayashii TaxID=2014872 RepID=A0A402AIJ1_9CHLR|nr:hypothetical protein [Dictyobacter kobayashii]GCE18926.1 hypothetical protein KDK_27260 [Dictyobacter kobayashii]